MILAIDVGNTNIVIGGVEGDSIVLNPGFVRIP